MFRSGDHGSLAQLCFAFRRWSDIGVFRLGLGLDYIFISLGADVAKEIYRNITAEKLALVRLLTEREKNAVAIRRSWEQANQVPIL